MTPSEDLTLRESLERLVVHERELREQAASMLAQTLEKQADEYERRLDELNHAHARSLQDRTDFLKKDIYEQTQKELVAWKLQVTAETTAMAERLKADQVSTATTLANTLRTTAETLAANQRFVNWVMAAAMIALSILSVLLRKGVP